MKEGSNGATLIHHGVEFHVDAFSSKYHTVVDTTGAGDTFTAAYAVSRNLTFATAAAFLCITREGAAQSIPSKQEVE